MVHQQACYPLNNPCPKQNLGDGCFLAAAACHQCQVMMDDTKVVGNMSRSFNSIEADCAELRIMRLKKPNQQSPLLNANSASQGKCQAGRPSWSHADPFDTQWTTFCRWMRSKKLWPSALRGFGGNHELLSEHTLLQQGILNLASHLLVYHQCSKRDISSAMALPALSSECSCILPCQAAPPTLGNLECLPQQDLSGLHPTYSIPASMH